MIKSVKTLFFVSLIIFIVAWLIPNLPWRPKRLEDYLLIYRFIFEAFRTWSMVSTAFSTLMILLYFGVTGAYNWRRQYTQSTKTEKVELIEDVSENEKLWEEIRSKKIQKTQKKTWKPLETREEMKKFLEGIKVFEYLEGDALEQVLRGSVLKTIYKNEILTVNKTDLVFVTFGSFKSSFNDDSSKANGLAVSCKRGSTLTSYSNVMRALAHFYNKTSDSMDSCYLKSSIKSCAQEDSQVLILNENCFIELAKVSKLSVAHLTQVILSRFKRATIPIVFDYFNLTGFATSFLGYFIKKSNGFNDVKLTDLLNCYQETFKTEDKILKVVLQYLIGSFSLDHTEFIAIESSLTLLKNHIQIKTCNKDEIIQEIGEECKGAFLVLEGNLKLSFSKANDSKSIEASVGDFVGIISSLMGKCSSIQVSPVNKTVYAVISQHLLEMISERDPKILFANIPDNKNTSQFIEFLDMCIDWRQLGSGETVETEKEIIKILHGRVREFKGQVMQERHLRELGSGSFLGEQGIFSEGGAGGISSLGSHELQQSAFYTVRQTEIASFPVDLIEGLVTANSEVAKAILPKLLARQKEDERSGVDPIKTICLLPVGVDYRTARNSGGTQKLSRDNQTRLTEGVAEYLQRTLKRHQTTFTVIDGVRAGELMGRQLFTTLGTLKMNEFLSSQEDVSKLIIYVADGIFSNWTKQCISQADLVLLIADLDDEVVEFGDLEKQMLQMNPLINVEICLMSAKNNRNDSRKWLKHRPWIKAHYHLSVPGYTTMTTSNKRPYYYNANILNMVPMDLFNNILRKSRDLLKPRGNQRRGSIFMTVEREDEIEVLGFGRLVRRILGRSIGLVLGGGGARGLSHLGIFKAFKEAGLQIDLIGGTSIGAFIGGLLAKEGLGNYQKVLGSVENFCRAMSSKWRQALDLTYPATSWFTGHAFNRALWKHFGFSGIEDFSVPFFAVTTDLTRSRLQLHRSGPAWKYVRASMSLSGFLPPVCDARDGTLLMDGGYLANVPIELMLNGALTELSELTVKNELIDERRDALSASIVIAIDVGKTSERVPIFYGDSLNGWSIIFKKLLKYFQGDKIIFGGDKLKNLPLTLDEIQFRLVYASSTGLLSRTLKRSHMQLANDLNSKPFVTVSQDSNEEDIPEVIYLRPTGVQQYNTLDFNKYKDIIKLGYDYGKRIIDEWRQSGLLKKLLEYQGVDGRIEDTGSVPCVTLDTAIRCRRSSI